MKKQGILGCRVSWSAAVWEVPNKTGTSVGARFPRVCHQGQYPAVGCVCRGNTQKGKQGIGLLNKCLKDEASGSHVEERSELSKESEAGGRERLSQVSLSEAGTWSGGHWRT